MTKKDKLLERFRALPKDFTWEEAETLLNRLGFIQDNKGKTSGSRVEFYKESSGKAIIFHKPHPGNIIKKLCFETTL